MRKNVFHISPFHIIIISTLILAAVIMFAALISLKLFKRFDLTVTKKYSLSEQTLNVLENIDRDINAIGFYTPAIRNREKIVSILKLFSDGSKFFTFEIVNPEKNPGRTRKYGKIISGMVVIESKDRWEKISKPDEMSILTAILRISSDEGKVIYFTQGHGERDPDDIEGSGFKRAGNVLESLGYEILTLDLLRTEGIPENADAVVVSGPEKDLFESELDSLTSYLNNRGGLLILADPNNLPNLEQFCRQLGIVLGKGVIVDKSNRISGSDYLMTLVEQYNEHELTAEIQSVTIFPLSRPVQLTGMQNSELHLVPLLRTGDESWLETDVVSLFNTGITKYDELNDERGPITIAVAGEVQNRPGKNHNYKGRFVVIGDSDFAANNYFDQGANGDLFVNSILWLNGEKDLMASRPFDREFYPIVLSVSQIKLLFWISTVLLPLIALVTGVVIIRRVRWRN